MNIVNNESTVCNVSLTNIHNSQVENSDVNLTLDYLRYHNSSTNGINILDIFDKLTPAKGKERYFCPVRHGNDRTVDPKTGKYQCWHGCECPDIREKVSHWDQIKRQRIYNSHL